MAKRGDTFQKSPETLKKAIVAMKRKIDKNKSGFLNADLTVEVELGDGRIVERANPLVQEYRALVRDYSTALKAYKEITEGKIAQEEDALGSLRTRFKVSS